MVAARYFPGQEITRGLQLALIEVAIGRVTFLQAKLGVNGLFQPAPADHAVAEGLEVQGRVRQGARDLPLGHVA
ncbi:hypothetical protein D3C79_546550 [compost metagenome]